MKKAFLLFAVLFFLYSVAFSQKGQSLNIGKNSFYTEWYGNGIYYSVNYERIYYSQKDNRLHFAARLGCSTYPNVYFPHKWLYVLPLEINAIFGKREHKFELGIGHTLSTAKFYFYKTDPQTYFRQMVLFTRFGYRCYIDGGVICRIGILPLLTYKTGKIPEHAANFGVLEPSTTVLINDNAIRRFSLGISAGLTFGYSF